MLGALLDDLFSDFSVTPVVLRCLVCLESSTAVVRNILQIQKKVNGSGRLECRRERGRSTLYPAPVLPVLRVTKQGAELVPPHWSIYAY